jgi:hypothetical protein
MACQHPQDSAIWSLSEIRQAYGDNAIARIPTHPEYIGLLNDAKIPVYLSRLTCKVHFAQISADTVAASQDKLLGPTPTVDDKKAFKAQLVLDKLLADAYDGKTVASEAVANARAAVLLEERTVQGCRDRAEAAAAKAAADARAALEAPAQERLAAAGVKLQGLLDGAHNAVEALLDGVDENMAEHDAVVMDLLAGGYDSEQLRTARGYVQQTVIGSQGFPYHLKAEYLLAILWQLRETKHRNAFIAAGGRSLSKDLPPLTDGGPRVSTK